MSLSVSAFNPHSTQVSVQHTGTIVVKLAIESGEVALFFTQASPLAVSVLGDDPSSPVDKVAHLVSSILSGAGFDYFTYEKADGLHTINLGAGAVAFDPGEVGVTSFDHPSVDVEHPDWIGPHQPYTLHY